MLELLAEYLKPEGFLIEPAHTAEEGLERVSKKHYDMILLDVMLPGINGFEALRRLRTSSQIPVLMLTGESTAEDIMAGYSVGADYYITKPFTRQQLIYGLNLVLGGVA